MGMIGMPARWQSLKHGELVATESFEEWLARMFHQGTGIRGRGVRPGSRAADDANGGY
jgi:hypothetical protein